MAVERNDVVSMLRDLEARRNARRRYLWEHERLEALSRRLAGQGQHYDSEGAHYWSMVALRAADAELRTEP